MNYPHIDPVIFALGPVALRWYGLAYLAAFCIVWQLGRKRIHRLGLAGHAKPEDAMFDLVWYGALGAILGGRLGFAIFYGSDLLLQDPLWLFRIWEGGLSFHGGLLGVCAGIWLQSRRSGLSFLHTADFVAPLVPTGLGLGRLGNFANTELPGRVTESGFGLHFPCRAVMELNPGCQGVFETALRHPSSLYQAFSEGLLLFALVWWYSGSRRITGQVSAVFLLLYGAIRLITELFRAPDPWLGFLFGIGITMGQCLSAAMVLIGALMYWRVSRSTHADLS